MIPPTFPTIIQDSFCLYLLNIQTQPLVSVLFAFQFHVYLPAYLSKSPILLNFLFSNGSQVHPSHYIHQLYQICFLIPPNHLKSKYKQSSFHSPFSCQRLRIILSFPSWLKPSNIVLSDTAIINTNSLILTSNSFKKKKN